MDGEYGTARHRLVLLTVTSLDADKEILILILPLISQEDLENWLRFLKKIAPYLTVFQDLDAVIISNRLKGIASAVTEYFLFATHSYCSKHLYDNVRHNYGEVVAQKFWECSYAKTESAFDKVLAKIQEVNDEVAEYILRLLRER